MKKLPAVKAASTLPAVGPATAAAVVPAGEVALRLLGPPALCQGAVACDLPGTLPGYLLAYLGHRQDWVLRDELSAVLWPQADAAQAQHNLRANVLRARAWLASHQVGGLLLAERTRLRLVLPCDSAALHALRRTSALASASGRPLPGGVFLQGWSFGAFEVFAEWAGLQRRELLAAWRDAIVHAPANAASGTCAQQSLAQAERYLEADPLDEDVMRCRLQALLALGRASEAAQAFALFDARQRTELGMGASPALAALVSSVVQGAGTSVYITGIHATAATPLAAAADGEASAPEDPGLLGRQADLQGLLGAWAQHRLVSLVGLGGIGKSVLARAALAAQAGPAVLWLPLAPLQTVAELPRYWAELAGLRLTPGGDAVAQLGAALADKPWAVVLDNAEHLLAEPGALNHLLQSLAHAASRLRLLVTSREPLQAASAPIAEHLQRLQGLALPQGDDAAAVLSSPAVRLLAASVRLARGAFDPRAELPGLAAIARATGGMPLALKIAGAWARVLPCAQIAEEIERSLAALDATPDGASGVRATLSRSWLGLQAPLPAQLAALSVFVGPFTPRAAQEVVQASLASLTALVDAGWLERSGEQHLHMHPLVRAYAAEQLATREKARRGAQESHATWVRQQLKPWADWRQTDQQKALQHIGELTHEASAAWGWALAHGRADFITDTAEVLSNFWEQKGLWDRSEQHLQNALGELDPLEPGERPAVLAALHALVTLRLHQSALSECEQLAERALVLAVSLGSDRARRRLLLLMGAAQWRLGKTDAAELNYKQSLALAQADGDLITQTNSLSNLAVLYKHRGDWATAEQMHRQLLTLQRESSDWLGLCKQLHNLAVLVRQRGRYDEALSLCAEGLALADAQGFTSMRSHLMTSTALIHMDAGRYGNAQAWAERGWASRDSGESGAGLMAGLTLANIILREGAPACAARAAKPLAHALRSARATSNQPARDQCLLTYGLWCGRLGRLDQRARVFASLIASPNFSAALREEIELEGQVPPATAAGDFMLLMEQALAELDAGAEV